MRCNCVLVVCFHGDTVACRAFDALQLCVCVVFIQKEREREAHLAGENDAEVIGSIVILPYESTQ